MPNWKTLTSVADAIPVALLGVDSKGQLRLANAAACELLACGRQQLDRRKLATLFRDPTQAVEFRASLRGRSAAPRRIVLQRADGRRLRVDATTRRLGRRGDLIISLRDIESERSDRRDLVESIGAVVHDMRNPLASLSGLVELLQRDCGERLGPAAQDVLGALGRNADRVCAQLTRLADLAHLPDRELERSWVLTNIVFEELAVELAAQLDEAGIQLVIPQDPQRVYANPARFRQVGLNLVMNAIQHMGHADAPEIQIDVKPLEAGSVLTIRDNGVGLPPDEHLRVSDLFRAALSDTEMRMTGLGLSIVRRIVSAHGGWIELSSPPGEGAVFTCFFPG
jgi:signal transduction histidine kinase